MTNKKASVGPGEAKVETMDSENTPLEMNRPKSCIPYFHPKNTWIRRWEDIVVISVFITVMSDSFEIFISSDATVTWVLSYCMDVIWYFDIVKKFLQPSIINGAVIYDRKVTRRRYLRGLFGLDLFTCLPTEPIVLVAPEEMMTMQTVAWCRVNRILRAYRLFTHFNARENELGSNAGILRLMKYIMVTLASTHVMACIWFSNACEGYHIGIITAGLPICESFSWATTAPLNLSDSDPWTAYAISLYYAMAMATSTGYGDIFSITYQEKIYSVLSMLVGIALFFGMLLGGMTSALSNADEQRAKYVHRLTVIKDHLIDMKITTDVKNMVMGYYDYLWVRKEGQTSEGLFSGLPRSFQAEIALTLNKPILEKAPLFVNLGTGFLRTVSLKIKPTYALPGQMIVNRGDVGSTMFFIQRGEVEVLDEENENAVATLRSGKIFGELSLILGIPRTASVRAVNHCDLMVLNNSDLHETLSLFPDVAKSLQNSAHDRLQMAITDVKVEDASRSRLFRAPSHIEPFVSKSSASIVFKRPSVKLAEDTEIYVATERDQGALCSAIKSTLIHPNSTLYKGWESFIIVLAVVVCLLFSYMACFTSFDVGSGYTSSTFGKVALGLSYVFDLCFIMDIVVNFRTAVVTSSGLKQDINSITKFYWKNGLFFDIVCVIPLEIFALCFTGNAKWTAFCFLRLNRILKASKVLEFFGRLEKELEINITIIRLFKLMSMIILTTHFFSCLWFVIVCHFPNSQCVTESWVNYLDVPNSSNHTISDAGMNYIRSLYWAAASMSSTGYGDIVAKSIIGRVLSILTMLVGLLLYGFVLANITAIIVNIDAPKVLFQQRIIALKNYMDRHHLAVDLKRRVLDYLALLWEKHRGQYIPGGTPLLHDIPIHLQQDIAAEEVIPILEQIIIFQETDNQFLRSLALSVTSYLYTPGDVIIYSGDVGRELYCIRRGTCRIVSDDFKTVYNHLSAGQYFGEMGLIFGEPRGATVQAVTHCDILVITKNDLDKVLKSYPLVEKQFKKAENERDQILNIQAKTKSLDKKPSKKISSLHDLIKEKEKDVFMTEKIHNLKKFTKTSTETDLEYDEEKPKLTWDYDYKRPFSRLNGFEKCLSMLLLKYSFLPRGDFVKYWTFMRFLLAIVIILMTPMFCSFVYFSPGMMVFAYFLDFICFIDIYISFHFAYYDSQNVLVTHPLSTARHYLKTNFLIDILSVLPYELIVFGALSSNLDGRVVQIIALCRLNRLLQFYRLPLSFNNIEARVETDTETLSTFKYICYTAILIQLTTCMMFVLACPPILTEPMIEISNGYSCREASWMVSAKVNLTTYSMGELYAICFYWASATTLSVGYGEVTANLDSAAEMIFCLFVIIMGVVYFGWLVAGVAAIVANADAQKGRFQDRVNNINKFLKDFSIARSMRERVTTYYDYVWRRTDGVDPDTLFYGLPVSLRSDITYSLYKHTFAKVSLFDGTSVSFQKMIARRAQPVFYLQGEYILRKNDIGNEMFFVSRGEVEVVTEDGDKVLEKLTDGALFGEVSLLFDCPRTESVRAASNVDVFKLSKADLEDVLTFYPELHQNLMEIAEARTGRREMQTTAISIKPASDNDDVNNSADKPKKRRKQSQRPDGKTKQLKTQSNCEQKPSSNVPCYRVTFSPHTRGMKAVRAISVLLNVISYCITFYQAAFQDHDITHYGFCYLCEIYFAVEMYFKFHLQYYDDNGDLETEYLKCKNNYMKKLDGGFAFDLICIFPLDLFCVVVPENQLFPVLSYLRLIHILRLYQVLNFFIHWERMLNVGMLKIRLLLMAFELGVIMHFFACVWYMLACVGTSCKSDSWFVQSGTNLVATDFFTAYIECLYWATATMTSTGYGDIHAYTTTERVVATFVMFAGKLMFGFVLANISSTQANAAAMKIKYDANLSGVKSHLNDREASPQLKQKVVEYFDYIWARNRGVDVHGLFDEAPYTLVQELFVSLFSRMFDSIQLLKGGEASFYRMLAPFVQISFHVPGDNITLKGDVEDHVFFIDKGQVEIIDDYSDEAQWIDEGEIYGEINLVQVIQNKVSLRATTHVDVFAISKADLLHCLLAYPSVRKQINANARELFGNTSSI